MLLIIRWIEHGYFIVTSWLKIKIRNHTVNLCPEIGRGESPWCAIITTYHRQQNVSLMIRSISKCRSIKKILVINANSKNTLNLDTNVVNVECVVVNTERSMRPGYRWYMAKKYYEEFGYFIALDDDTILNPLQMQTIVNSLENDPSSPKGVIGSVYQNKPRCFSEKTGRSITEYYKSTIAKVDVIHQVYAVTKDHIRQFHKIADQLETYNVYSEKSIGDDIIISHSGNTSPSISAVGSILECPLSHVKGVAVHSEDDAEYRRCMVFEEIHTKKLYKWDS